MARTRRIVQVTLAPGATWRSPAKLKDTKGHEVDVVVTARRCDDPGVSDAPTVVTSGDPWQVEVPPETVYDVDGLADLKGVIVLLTIATTACAKSTSPPPVTPAPVKDSDVDVAAPAPPVRDGRPDVTAEEAPLDRTDYVFRGSEDLAAPSADFPLRRDF